MITLAKLFLVTIVASAGACGIGSLGTAVYLYSGGIAAVDVETADVDLFIPVPLRLLDVGLGVARIAAPDFDIESELDAETRERLREMQPMIEELVDELGSLPSGDLVRVRNGDDLVVVRSARGHLKIEVDTPDARVRVSVPQRGARRVSKQALSLAGF